MEAWTPIPIDQQLFRNVDEAAARNFATAMENAYLNDLGGVTRFPGFEEFARLDDNGRVYLYDWNNDLIAATSKGQVYRIDRAGRVENVTGVPLSGGRRAIFTKGDREMQIVAGGPPVRLRDQRTEILNPDLPSATFIATLDNYTILSEVNSGRFVHTPAGQPAEFNPLDTLSADGNPDNINAMIVTPFRELMITGAQSIEQFEPTGNGERPFARRFSIGDGVSVPYAMLFADNAVFTINGLKEVVRFAGQVSSSESRQIGRMLERVDDWSDAWIGGYPDKPLHLEGMKFLLLQIPNATNIHGTQGITLVFDYANKRWFELFGWDNIEGVPTRWPGWSHWTMWDETFIGGEGVVYRMTGDQFTHAGGIQRALVRTGIFQVGDQAHVKNFRLQIKRGMGGPDTESFISVRCSRNGRPFGNFIRRSLGRMGVNTPILEFGQFGQGATFQWEISVASDVEIEIVKAEVKYDGLGQ